MSLKPVIYTGITAIIIMFGIKFTRGSETLVTENGKVSAATLPLDKKTAAVKYQTATFGMG
ncbi:hypothetical protein [Oceaniferula spumae]